MTATQQPQNTPIRIPQLPRRADISLGSLMRIYNKNYRLFQQLIDKEQELTENKKNKRKQYSLHLSCLRKEKWTTTYRLRYEVLHAKSRQFLVRLVDIHIEIYHDSKQAAISQIPVSLQKYLHQNQINSILDQQYILNYFLFNLLLSLVWQSRKKHKTQIYFTK